MVASMLKTRRTLLYAITGAVVLVVGAFALAYFVLFPTSSPEKFALSESEATPAATATATATSGSGRWTVADGSEAGYRVREKLAFLPAKNDAVGRTPDITGAAESTGSGDDLTIATASFKIDVSTLTSDEDRRDQRIRTIGIESDRFPTATFELSEPIELSTERERDRRPHAARRDQARDDPAAGAGFRLDAGRRRLAHVPLGRLRHDRAERRRLRERRGRGDVGVRPQADARLIRPEVARIHGVVSGPVTPALVERGLVVWATRDHAELQDARQLGPGIEGPFDTSGMSQMSNPPIPIAGRFGPSGRSQCGSAPWTGLCPPW
jgi:polyisoprenoid-binding protein YceI